MRPKKPENMLIANLIGVESLRAGKQTVMFLTKDGVFAATPGFAETIDVPGAPSVALCTTSTWPRMAASSRVPSA